MKGYERLGKGLAQARQIWICMGPFKIIQGWNYPVSWQFPSKTQAVHIPVKSVLSVGVTVDLAVFPLRVAEHWG